MKIAKNPFDKIFSKRPAFIGYLTAGHMGLRYSLAAALALVEGGVDILEIGVPFSDPIADGKVIQTATSNALQRGVTLYHVLNLIHKIKKYTDVPIVLFSYFNPILQATQHDFYARAHTCGVDSILVVDLPLNESDQHIAHCQSANMLPIFVVAPSTTNERLKIINTRSQGFVYYVSRNGTTGIKSQLPNNFVSKIQTIKKCIDSPVVAGFGIANKESAKEVIQYADGFVVGSLFVDAIIHGANPKELKALAKQIDPRK